LFIFHTYFSGKNVLPKVDLAPPTPKVHGKSHTSSDISVSANRFSYTGTCYLLILLAVQNFVVVLIH